MSNQMHDDEIIHSLGSDPDGYSVVRTRVPGGWIYTYRDFEGGCVNAMTSAFVPDPQVVLADVVAYLRGEGRRMREAAASKDRFGDSIAATRIRARANENEEQARRIEAGAHVGAGDRDKAGVRR